MKKLLLGAAVSAALFGGVAQADLPAVFNQTPNTGNRIDVSLSGASAPRVFIETAIRNTTIFCTGALVGGVNNGVYTYQDSSSNNYNVYACEMSPALKALVQAAPGGAGKTHIVFHKRSAGGSDFGVTPVANDSDIQFMDVDNAGCAAPAGGAVATCAALIPAPGRPADFGVSDVDPAQFGLTPALLANLNVRSAFIQPFGIPVTLNFYRALQAMQFTATNKCNPGNLSYNALATSYSKGAATKAKIKNGETAACQPSLSKETITSILTGKLYSLKQLNAGVAGAAGPQLMSDAGVMAAAITTAGVPVPGSEYIHVCGRVNTSGTYRTTLIKFLNNPCSSAASAPQAENTFPGVPFPGYNPAEAGQVTQVYQLSSGGNVNECLNDLNAGTGLAAGNFVVNGIVGPRYAIGYQALDNNANLANAYRYVKIDGVTPTAQNVASGAYHFIGESTYQYNTGHTFAAGVKAAMDFFVDQTNSSNIVGQVNQSGAGCPLSALDPLATAGYPGIGAHCFGDAGFLGSPTVNTQTNAGNVGILAANPVSPISHDTNVAGTVINNCRAPALYNVGPIANPNGMSYRIQN